MIKLGSSVQVRWSDGKVYTARVLNQHKAPSYVVTCPQKVVVTVTDEDQIFSTREKLPQKLINKLKVMFISSIVHVCHCGSGLLSLTFFFSGKKEVISLVLCLMSCSVCVSIIYYNIGCVSNSNGY